MYARRSVIHGPFENPTRFSLLDISDRLLTSDYEAVICLTVAGTGRDYSRYQGLQNEHGSMSNDCSENESPLAALKSESARQRWELFHRAIAHAKQSNSAALQEPESTAGESKRTGPILSIVR